MKRGLLFTAAPLVVFSFFLYLKNNIQDYQGEQIIYSYTSEGIGYSDIEKLYSNDTSNAKNSFFNSKTLQKANIRIKCQVKKTFVKENQQTQLAGIEIIDPEVVIENNGLPVDTDLIEKELKQPVFMEVTNTGKIINIRIDTAISYLSANTVKEILSHLQFVKDSKKSVSWQTEEENTSGTYLAKYTFIKDSNKLSEYSKTNERYIKLKSGRNKHKIIVDSRSKIYIDSSGSLQKTETSEAQFILFASDTITASGSQSHVQFLSSAIASKDEMASLDKSEGSSNYSETTTLSAGLSEDKINRMAYKNTLGNENWETLFQQLNNAKEQDTKTKEQLVLRFRALAYLFPETCQKIEEILITEPFGSFTFNVLSEALAQTETAASTNALVNVISQRKNEEDVLIELLPALAISRAPTDHAVNITKALAFDMENAETIRMTSQLSLAALTYNFRKSDIKKSQELTGYILNKMKNETDTIQKILVLGNTGSPAVIPALKAFLFSKQTSRQVKAYAIGGFKLIDDKEIPKLLKTVLTNKDGDLKNAAAKTISFRNEYFAKERP